jgi:ABC-type sulfate/molybdate transport systems ATPase subunit
MREQHRVTSIVITHDMVTAREVADRVLVLARGKVAACGTPGAILPSLAGAAARPSLA